DTYPLSLHDALPISSNSLRRVVTDFRRAMYSSSSVINPASDSIFKRFSVDRSVSISARLSLPGTNTCSRTRFGPSAVKKAASSRFSRSEEHTSELQSRENLVCRLLLEKKNKPK